MVLLSTVTSPHCHQSAHNDPPPSPRITSIHLLPHNLSVSFSSFNKSFFSFLCFSSSPFLFLFLPSIVSSLSCCQSFLPPVSFSVPHLLFYLSLLFFLFPPSLIPFQPFFCQHLTLNIFVLMTCREAKSGACPIPEYHLPSPEEGKLFIGERQGLAGLTGSWLVQISSTPCFEALNA